MTRSDLRTRILEALGESTTAPIFWSSSQMNDLIDEAQEVLAEEAAQIKRTAYVPLKNGTTYYRLRAIDPNAMTPYRIYTRHNERRLTVATVMELFNRHQRWISVNSDPESWFPISWDMFGIFPSPSTGGGIMEINYLSWPRPLADDDDEPEFPQADHEGLVLYGVYEGLLKRWDITRATELFTFFMDRWGDSRIRSGTDKIKSRDFQRSRSRTGFKAGVTF